MTKWFSFLLFKGFVLCSKRRDQAALRKPVHEETGNGNLFLILSLFLSKAKITDEKNNRKKKENKKISLRKKGELKNVSNQSITYIATTPVRTAPIKDYNAIVIHIELNSPLC